MSDDLHRHDGTSAEDPSELLGAYALDALDDVDRRRVERLLASDPVAQAEADRLDRVADRLAEAAAEGAAAPSGLLDSILGQAASRPAGTGQTAPTDAPAVEPVILPPPIAPRSADGSSTDERADDARSADPSVVPFARPAARRSPAAWILSAAAVVLLVVVGAFVVVGRSGDDQVDPEVAMEQLAREAATLPGARTGELTDPDQTMAVEVVVDPQGHAFLMAGALPALDDAHTYQLWAVDGGTPVSLGLLGSSPSMSVVGVDGQVTTLAITLEPAGGSADPTSAPMASGTLSEA